MNDGPAGLAEVLGRFRPSSPGPKRKDWPGTFRRKVFGRTLKSFLRLSESLAEDSDPELIHDLRVQARRLLEELRIVKTLAGARRTRRCRGFLDGLIRRLSPVRNADVSRALLGKLNGEDPAPGEKEARALLDEALGGRRTRRLKKALAFWKRGKSRKRRELLLSARRKRFWGGGGRSRNFSEAFCAHLERRLRQSRLRLSGAGLSSADEDLHLLRITLRRLRYSGEAARTVAGGPGACEIERVRALQAALGDCHDLAVLSRRIARAGEGLAENRTARDLQAGLNRLSALCAARFDARLQAFRRLLS